MSYQPGVPTGLVPLNQDYLNLQGNFTQLSNQFLVNHVPLTSTSGTPPNGYHTQVNLVPFSTTTTNPPNNQPVIAPTATTGYGQLFSSDINDGINDDTALYWLSGGNKLIQLTRNFNPVLMDPGYTCLPGGLILQWASVLSTTSGIVTFPIEFPNHCLSVWTQPLSSSTSIPGSQATVSIPRNASGDLISKTGFSWNFVTNSADYRGFFWLALGW